MIEINISGHPAAYLDGLGKYSKLALIEQSSKAGSLARDSIRNEFSKATTEWGKKYRLGKLVAFKRKSKLGMRISHSSPGQIGTPGNMKHLITSYTNTTTGTTVIMGAYKGYKPIKIENGKITGYEKYQPSLTRRTLAILEKLNSGKKSNTYNKEFPKGTVKGQFRGSQSYKNRQWAERGFSSAYSQVKNEMTNKLLGLIANYELQKGQTA